jgi:23S rRNA (cytosine1962-C5)-methyltransferase
LQNGVFAPGTTGGRWINGESDGFPGLVADRYGTTVVVKLYSPAWLARWTEIEGLLREVFNPEFLVLRLSRNLMGRAERAWGMGEGFRGDAGEEIVVFEENGLKFEAAVLHGQKTGFFLDQRENRQRAGLLAQGRACLNAFSYSGGFSLYAARGGASSVTDLDISGYALESAQRNFALNQAIPEIAPVRHELIQADAFDWLKGSPAGQFGLAVLDPPSLAPRQADRESALEGYASLAAGGIRVLGPGGILIAASCSSHVNAEEFFTTVRSALQRSGRRWREEWTSGHAADHPATFPEAHYLKAICARLEP